jgi:hypothetical protein
MLRASGGSAVMSWPRTRTRPASGASKPAIMRSVVVLPQPDGPRREKNSPSAMASDTSSTARAAPAKTLVTRSSAMAASGIGGHRGVIGAVAHPHGRGR